MSVQMSIAQLRTLLDGYDADAELYVDLAVVARHQLGAVAPAPTGEFVGVAEVPDVAPALTADDFPVGTAIRWSGARFVGNGEVIKHNDDGSVSVRIFDERARTNKRVNLNTDDIASGNLVTR